jgi:hypothetical protein
LIQVLPWNWVDYKPLHDRIYLSPKPHTNHDSHVLIYSFNTRSLPLHKNDVFSDYNIKQFTYCASMKHISTH